jgi:hypothetical protein
VAWAGTDGVSGAGLTLHHHHSLDSYGAHEMARKHYILSHASKHHQVELSVDAKVPKFLTSADASQKVALLGTDGDSGAGLTLHHHSLW